MRSVSSGLLSACVAGVVTIWSSIGAADARGLGGGVSVGGRGGSGLAHRGAGFGGRGAAFGRRLGPGVRFGRGHGYGPGGSRFGSGYGLGYLSSAYGGYGYGAPYPASFGSAYDPGPPTSIGIPPSPVAPPAIYVLGGPDRAKASGVAARGRGASRTLTARSGDAAGDSFVVSGGPRIIRITR